MTLTPEQVAEYEARAAKGETPKLPWAIEGAPLDKHFSMHCYIRERRDGPAIGEVRLRCKCETRSSYKASCLAADDALRAFAAPLLDARPKNKGRFVPHYNEADGTWNAAWLDDDGQYVEYVQCWGANQCDSELYAQVCADAINEWVAELDSHAPVEGPWEVWQGGLSGIWKVGDGWLTIECIDQAEAEAIARVRNEAWQRRQKEKGNA